MKTHEAFFEALRRKFRGSDERAFDLSVGLDRRGAFFINESLIPPIQTQLGIAIADSHINLGGIPPFNPASSATHPKPIAELSDEALRLSSPSPGTSTEGYGLLGVADGKSRQTGGPQANYSGYLVQFQQGATARQKAAAASAAGGRITKVIHAADAQMGDLVVLEAIGRTPASVKAALGISSGVRFVEQNWTLGIQVASNDTYYSNGNLWGMYGDSTSPANVYGSQAGEAWAAGYTGKSTIVVGDIDTGLDYTHRDLYLNVWLNQGELPGAMTLIDSDQDGLVTFRDLNQSVNSAYVSDLNLNGYIDAGDLLRDARWEDLTDQDANGYVDDLIGWDFVNNDNDPYDDNGHGTHTAGTIGATGGNGTGVAGVSWNTEIMALKFLSGTGSGALSDAIKAIDYYTAASAQDKAKGWTSEFIGTNNSWGGGGFSQSLLDAIVRGAKQDTLFIAAAGNGGSDGIGDNNNSIANYPSNYSTLGAAGFEAVIAVASITNTGALSSFSNYGSTTVDLGAPGSGIWSTIPGGGYASFSGTSMATPHVTGALALYASLHPEFSASQLRAALMTSTLATTSLANKTVSGGRLDVGKLMGTDPTVTPIPTGGSYYGTTSSDTILGSNYADTLCGIPATGAHLGKGTIDKLYGKAGDDIFILGDARGRFYDDGSTANAGRNDYALIADFSLGDKIQLKSGNYFLSTTSLNGVTGTGIFYDTNGKFDNKDELIGLVQSVSASSITSNSIVWV